MRIINIQAQLERIRDLDILHAELTLQTIDGVLLYLQAHDNTAHRSYALTTCSYFDSTESGAFDDQEPLEEYSTDHIDPESTTLSTPELIKFVKELGNRWKEDFPAYDASSFSSFFMKLDQLLDNLTEEHEDSDYPLLHNP